jgi:transcriptional antiterminator RfaH
MQWHIALAEPNKESLAFSHLMRLRYEAYYPKFPVLRKLYGKMTTVFRPMFPGYIFVRPGANQDWYRLETAPGVRVTHSLLRIGDSFATITREEMKNVTDKAKELCEQIHETRDPKGFSIGDEVKIRIGPFAEFLATIETLDDDARNVGLITYLFGRQVRIRAHPDHLSAA